MKFNKSCQDKDYTESRIPEYIKPECKAKEMILKRVLCLSNERVSYEEWIIEEENENNNE